MAGLEAEVQALDDDGEESFADTRDNGKHDASLLDLSIADMRKWSARVNAETGNQFSSPARGDFSALNEPINDGDEGANQGISSDQTSPPQGATSITENAALTRSESDHDSSNVDRGVEWI